MKFLRFALVAAASTLAFNAQADATDWGVHSALEVGVSLTPVGSFADTYLFKRLDPMALFAITVANNQLPALNLNPAVHRA